MSIEFTVEDGTGKSDATSYLSVADADQLVENFDLSWSDGVTPDNKETALNNATRYLDNKYNGLWKGYKLTLEQALAWPRGDVIDTDGWDVATDSIPTLLLQATVEVAVYYDNNDAAYPDLDDAGSIKREKIKIDVLEFDTEFLSSNAGSQIAAKVESLLLGFLKGRGANAEVTRG